jgi:hypothetical protein
MVMASRSKSWFEEQFWAAESSLEAATMSSCPTPRPAGSISAYSLARDVAISMLTRADLDARRADLDARRADLDATRAHARLGLVQPVVEQHSGDNSEREAGRPSSRLELVESARGGVPVLDQHADGAVDRGEVVDASQ